MFLFWSFAYRSCVNRNSNYLLSSSTFFRSLLIYWSRRAAVCCRSLLSRHWCFTACNCASKDCHRCCFVYDCTWSFAAPCLFVKLLLFELLNASKVVAFVGRDFVDTGCTLLALRTLPWGPTWQRRTRHVIIGVLGRIK